MKHSKKTTRLAVVDARKVAIYIRVSTKFQIDKDSLPLQREDLQKYADIVLGIKDFEVFEDAGYSAKNTQRPAYQQMMSRIRTGEFSHVLVWKIDRISRNLLDFASMYKELKDYGVVFVSKNEQFDTSSAIGEAMLKIILVFAELERNMTSERVSAVLVSRAAQGNWNGGRVPFGYRWNADTQQFEIAEEEAKVVRMIYERYKSTSSLAIARELNERGVFHRSGRAWSATTVVSILRSPFYCGKLRYNYRNETNGVHDQYLRDSSEWILVDDHHEPIISEDEWMATAKKLDENRRGNHGHKTYMRGNTHIFAGLLTCGYCGSNMSATKDRERADGWRPSIYNCFRHRKYNDCKNKYVSDVTLGPFVFNYIANLIKARNSFGKTTSIETFEKKLLRGSEMKAVDHIERSGLEDMYNLIKSGKTEIDYEQSRQPESSKLEDERSLLRSERYRKERALKRLEALYLYDESGVSETEYIIKRKELTDSIDALDERLEELGSSIVEEFNMTDSEFIEKASYFIMSQQLSNKRNIEFSSFIKAADPNVVRDFLKSVIQNFCILDGKIQSITFKNGIEHRFVYKEPETAKAPKPS